MLDCITLDASNTIMCRPNSRQNNRLEEEMYVSRHLIITYVLMVAASDFPLTTHYILHSSVSLRFTFVSHISANNFVTLCYIWAYILKTHSYKGVLWAQGQDRPVNKLPTRCKTMVQFPDSTHNVLATHLNHIWISKSFVSRKLHGASKCTVTEALSWLVLWCWN